MYVLISVDQRRLMECEGKVIDEKECEVQYVVSGRNVETNKTHVRAEQSPSCLPDAPIVPIVLSVVGLMLLIGIATLLTWKVLTHLHDKKEFTRFENERANAIWPTVRMHKNEIGLLISCPFLNYTSFNFVCRIKIRFTRELYPSFRIHLILQRTKDENAKPNNLINNFVNPI